MAIVLADNTPRIEYTVAQGVTQTVFPIPFVFFNKEDSNNVDVKVFVDGVERTLGSISTTTFSITSGGNGAKGSLSTTVTGASGGSTVIVLRDTKIGRTTDFPSGGAFEVSKLNTELDTLVAIEGDFEDHVSRSIRLQDKDTAVSLALPLKADRLGKQLGFNATTGAVEMFTPESLAIASDSGTSSVDLTSNTFTFTGGEGIDTSISNQTLTITGELASTSNKGVASFNSTNFTVSSGAVTAKNITLASDSGSATNTLGETFTLSGGTGLNTSATGSTVTMNVDAAQTGITSLLATDIKIGEDDQTKIDFETADQINFYANNVNVVQLSNANSGDAVFTVPTSDKDFVIKGNDGGSTITALTIDMSNSGDASFNNNVIVGGNLTVNGSSTTVNTATLTVEDPLISLASGNNSADSVDVGFYGLYDTSGSQDLYAGLFRDASDSGKFKLFKDLQVEPTTTVNTSGTGYSVGTLVANLEGTIQTAAQTNITSLGTLTGLTSSGTINTVTTGIAIQPASDITSNDVVLIRANPSGSFGFDIKYMGSRSGTANSYSLFMHNQTGSHIEAMTVFQDGKVGINQTTPTASLHVGDTALFDDDVTFTGTNGNIVFDKSDDALEFADNVKAVFGDSGINDFFIQFSGTQSQIAGVKVRALTNDFRVKNPANNETMITALQNGAVELYHDNVKKFETTATGATVTGTLVADGVTLGDGETITFGTDSDATLKHSGSRFEFFNDVGSIIMRTNSNSSDIVLQTDDGSGGFATYLRADGSTGAVQLSHYNNIKLSTTSTGATVTGTLVANLVSIADGSSTQDRLTIGTNNDFFIYHDNQTVIANVNGSGPIKIQGKFGEQSIVANQDGSVELHHNGSKKLETTATGATVTGTLVADGVFVGDNEEVQFGAGTDLRIFHDGNNNIFRGASRPMYIQTDNTIFLTKNAASETMAKFISDGAVELYHNNVKTFETTASGAKIHGNTGDAVLLLEADTGNNDEADNAYIEFTQDGGGVSAKSGIGVDGNNRYQVSTTTGGGTTKFDIHGGAETRLYYASDIKLETESNGVTITSSSGDTKLFIEADPSNSNEGDNAFLIFKLDGGFETSAVWSGNFGGSNDNALNLTNAGQFGGGIRFGTTTTNNAWETATERMRIDRHGDITTFGTNGNITFDYSADSLIFDDNVEAKFGTGGDLRIYHNGSNSYIDEGSGEGALIFKSNIFSFRNAPDSQQMALFNQGGNVRLFHAGAEKFQTLSTGAKVFGDLTIVNSDDDANANPSLIIDRGSSSPANSDAIGEIIFRGRDSGGAGTDYANIAAVIGDVTDPQEDAYLRFRARVGGANIQHIQCGFSTTDIFGRLRLNGNNHFADPTIVFEGQTADAHETELKVVDPTADRTITFPDATGTVLLDTGNQILTSHMTFADNAQLKFGTGEDLIIRHDGNHSLIEDNGSGDLYIRASDNLNIQADNGSGGWQNAIQTQFTGTNAKVAFFNGGTQVFSTLSNGISIDVSGGIRFEGATADGNETFLQVADPTADRTITLPDLTGTVALTSQLSDIRDKKDVQDLQLGLDFVNAMRPVQFTWDRRDGSYNDVKELGFIAQELDQVERQFDTKDRTKLVTEMSEDELHVSPMNSYPILVKAIQELSAQVESLQARVKELEG